MEAIKKALDDTYPTIAFDDLRGGDRVIAEECGEYTEGVITDLKTGLYGGPYWETEEGAEIWENADLYLVDRPEKIPDDPHTILLRIKAWGGVVRRTVYTGGS